MDLHIKDVVELKKTHPCGSKQWEITRVGMDIKLKCLGCGHEHNCGIHGCAVIRQAAERLAELTRDKN